MNFEQLNLIPPLLRAVGELGYTEATPIQEEAIPLVLAGDDVLAGAQTGTGKTAAFGLPMLQLLSASEARAPGAIRALILTPTRELAAQIDESMRDYGKHLELRSTVIFGGVSANPQIKQLQAGCDILVATPGRLLDLHEQGYMNLGQVEILVLDEADRMLDMGFIHDVRKILALLPKQRQNLLFSATFGGEVRKLAQRLLHNPRSVQVTPPNTTVELIQQTIYPVGRDRKSDALLHLMQENNWKQVLVFTRTKFGANTVASFLNENGFAAMALHGNKSQRARTEALDKFKNGQLQALVATDIAARGIDISELPHVVNYDIPNVPEDYVHRIGRTGRAGADGHAASLVCMDEEGFMHAIERFTGQQIPVVILPEYGPAEGEKAEPIAMGRQTLWGGLGPTPSREVMQRAGREARRQMMERIRASKARNGAGQNAGRGNRRRRGRGRDTDEQASSGARTAAAGAENQAAESSSPGPDSAGQEQNQARPQGRRNQRRRGQRRHSQRNGVDARPAHDTDADRPEDRQDRLPSNIDPLQINLGGARRRRKSNTGGSSDIPDPLRTGAEMMGNKGGGRHGRGSGGGRNQHKRSRH